MEKETITTRDQAEQKAIDWQNWMSEQDLSYSELLEWGEYFSELAVRFDLVDEFRENCII